MAVVRPTKSNSLEGVVAARRTNGAHKTHLSRQRILAANWALICFMLCFNVYGASGTNISPWRVFFSVALAVASVPVMVLIIRPLSKGILDRALLLLVYSSGACLSAMALVPFYVAHGLFCGATGMVVHSRSIAVYFSVVSLTTLGFGDYVPTDGLVRFLAAAEAVWGYVLLGILVAGLVAYFRPGTTSGSE